MGNLVSIVIPCYNRRQTISRAIDSCLKQSYDNIEIVVCDDHSTDGTLDYIKEKYKTVSNIKFCITPEGKKGANAARNEGIRVSNGEYVAFLDSDDYLTENSIEIRYNIITKTDSALAYGDIYYQCADGSAPIVVKYDDMDIYNQKRYLMEELSLCTFDVILVRKSILIQIGFLDENLKAWQDDDLAISIGMKYKIIHCHEPIAVMVESGTSISTNMWNRYQGLNCLLNKYKFEIKKEVSNVRYIIWKIRLFASWLRYKEQNEENKIVKKIYRIVYTLLYRRLNLRFRHIWG